MVQDVRMTVELLLAWESVREDRNIVVGNLNAATMAGRPPSGEFHDLVFNLLLARGYSVLQDTLEELRLEGRFVSKSRRLGDLMHASLQSVPWRRFTDVDRGRDRRNHAIHDHVRLPHAECRDYLALVQQELAGWRVIRDVKPELWHW